MLISVSNIQTVDYGGKPARRPRYGFTRYAGYALYSSMLGPVHRGRDAISVQKCTACACRTLYSTVLHCAGSGGWSRGRFSNLLRKGHSDTPLDYNSRFGRGDTISLQPLATRTKSLGRCTGGLKYTWALGTL
eukprot:scaffold87907_cov60-Phaeocystis_antarctica.AAC.2